MARTFECPKCGIDISDSYQGPEPNVGLAGGYFCDACGEGFADDNEYEGHDDDVSVFGTGGNPANAPHERCPKCLSANLEVGFGLAGGGCGPYSFCPSCGIVVNKSQDPT